jgi:hypothetical protein
MIAPFSIDFFQIQASAQAIITIKIVPPVIVAVGGTIIIADDGAPDNAPGRICAHRPLPLAAYSGARLNRGFASRELPATSSPRLSLAASALPPFCH